MALSPQLERLQKRMEAIPIAVREALAPALVKSGEELADLMRHLAVPSRDTGSLIDSIEVTGPGQMTPPHSQPGGATVVADNQVLVTAGNSEARYAHLVEYGTSEMEAQPFFNPAVRLLNTKIKNRLKRASKVAVRKNWDKP